MINDDAVNTSGPKRRGRPRSEAARARVLRAARALLETSGPAAVTIERLAEHAGVGKPTIYRTWPNAQAVLMAALMPEAPAAARRPATTDALAQLRRQLRDLAGRFSARSGRSVTLMLAAAEPDSELARAFRHRVILAAREEGRRLLRQAVTDGALRRGIDLDVALNVLYGPLFLRVLLGHGPVDTRFADRVVALALRGLRKGR